MTVERNGKTLESCIRDEHNVVVAWQAGMSEADIVNMLKRHTGWVRGSAYVEI